jgi:Zn-dependent protease with chaperone function/type II secretory pathway pseudopilin PulG
MNALVEKKNIHLRQGAKGYDPLHKTITLNKGMGMELVYKNEKKLFALMLALSVLGWIVIVLGTVGMALVYAVLFFLGYCFAQSALISYLKGNAVRITEDQFPDLKHQISACCRKLGLDEEPDAYLLQMGGVLNAFATRFFGRNFLVLYSDVVDGLADNPDALNFYIGHEIGHIKRKHMTWHTVLMPASVLPLVGAAYSRAREYTCDRHGLAACDDAVNAEYGLAVLAAGGKRWRTMNNTSFIEQSRETEGFWMSFHELVGDYPWLAKRMGAVRALAAGQEASQPRRHLGAKLLALFVPRLGIAGSGAGAMVTVAIIGILAAVAVPAYQEYVQKSKVAQAYAVGRNAAAAVENYYVTHHQGPATLEQAGAAAHPAGAAVELVSLSPQNGQVKVVTTIGDQNGRGALTFTPSVGPDKRVSWRCEAEGLRPAVLPPACR